jgi:MFS family permease
VTPEDGRPDRALALAQASGALASTATWGGAVVLAIAGYKIHGTAGVSAAIVARTVPGAIAAPLVALAADRRSRRDVLLIQQALAAVALALLAPAAATVSRRRRGSRTRSRTAGSWWEQPQRVRSPVRSPPKAHSSRSRRWVG